MAEPATRTASDAEPAAARRRRIEPCPSCGAPIAGRFCMECGEMRPGDRLYRLRDFGHEAFEVVTNVERSLLRTLATLGRRPGELTAAYMRGERVRYLRPLQLFLLANVAYFLWAGWAGVHVFNTRFTNHVNSTPYASLARRAVARSIGTSGETVEAFADRFNAKVVVLARSLIIVMVPVFALVMAALSWRRRRPAVHHLVFSIHLFTTMLAATMAVSALNAALQLVLEPLGHAMTWQAQDSLAAWLMALLIGGYLFAAFRRAYADRMATAFTKAVASVFLLTLTLVLYRALLFFATVASL